MRIPDLDGGLNFRDMGGYPASDGRSIKWRILFRSGSTHAMTMSDLQRLSHLRFAYDLRSNSERSTQPSRLTQIPGLSYHCRDHEHIGGDLQRFFESDRALPEHSRGLMLDLYRQLPHLFQESFKDLFEILARGDVPLVFNCAAGKDRTGVAAALVLASLGVPRDIILSDYLLTEQFFDRSCALLLVGHYQEVFRKVHPAVWEPLMRVHPDYLNAMFDLLIERHGSVENYLGDALGLRERMIEQLRDQLLE